MPQRQRGADRRSAKSRAIEALGSQIVGMAGRIAAASCRWLLLVAEFDAQEGAGTYGLGSTARWLMHYCGLSRRTAIEHVRVARALAANPPLAEAMTSGRLSFSHARAIARVAPLGGPELVADLVMFAEHGTVGQLEDLVRGLRTVDDNNQPELKPVPEAVSAGWRDDARWKMTANLDPDHGALLASVLDLVGRREGLTQPQALTRMAELALMAVQNTDGKFPALRGDEAAAVVIHLDASRVPADEPPVDGPASAPGASGTVRAPIPTAADEPTAPGGAPDPAPRVCSAEHPAGPAWRPPYARIAGGPGLSDAMVRRLLCGARVRPIVFDPRVPPGQTPTPLDVGGTRRLVSARQFRALKLRDGGCAHPGCGSTIALEAHHVKPWIFGGRTVMANLVLLCRRHHHAHHDGEFRIVPDGKGRFRFLRADGRELPRHVNPAAQPDGPTRIEDDHPDVTADAATTRWDGRPLDRHYATAVLAQDLESTRRPA
jgi:hypothetical protein